MSKERSVVEDGNALNRIGTREGSASEPVRRPVGGGTAGQALGERVVALERELERRQKHHHQVVAQYEDLLEEAREDANDGGYVDWLRSLL